MEAIIISILIVLALSISLLLGNWMPLVLPSKSSFFDRKPFNCRPCTTFHLTWIFIGVLAIFFHSKELAILGFIIAFIVFFIIRKIDNNKIIK